MIRGHMIRGHYVVDVTFVYIYPISDQKMKGCDSIPGLNPPLVCTYNTRTMLPVDIYRTWYVSTRFKPTISVHVPYQDHAFR